MRFNILMTVAFFAIVNSSPALSDTPYSNTFKEELCLALQDQLPESIPGNAYYIEERFIRYTYLPKRYYTFTKQCNFSNETDITLNIDVNLEMSKRASGPNVAIGTEFSGKLACTFSSQYEWFCGFSSISKADSIIQQCVRDAQPDPGDGCYSYQMQWTDTQWQTDLLRAAENTLSEYY